MAISQQDLTPSKDSYNNQMKDILWREITGNSMQELQKQVFHLKNTDVRKVAYSFIVMEVMDKVGIQQQSQIIKAIAEVQKLIGSVVGDLAKLENLLSELGMLPGSGKHGYPSNDAIKAWLKKNGAELTKVWNDLFGKNGLMSQLKGALNNPYYKQNVGTGFKSIMDLDGDKSPFSSGDWANKSGSFLDFLHNGKITTNLLNLLHHICYETYEHNTKGTGHDQIGDAKTTMETAKQEENGMSTTESTDMSMYSQNLTSEIQIAQQVLQSAAKETSSMVAQQNAR
jgi:hypothetical protein